MRILPSDLSLLSSLNTAVNQMSKSQSFVVRELATRAVLFGAGSFCAITTLFYNSIALSKSVISLGKYTIGQISFKGEKLGNYLPEGFELKEIGLHAYNVLFSTFNIFFTPIAGLAYPKGYSWVTEKLDLAAKNKAALPETQPTGPTDHSPLPLTRAQKKNLKKKERKQRKKAAQANQSQVTSNPAGTHLGSSSTAKKTANPIPNPPTTPSQTSSAPVGGPPKPLKAPPAPSTSSTGSSTSANPTTAPSQPPQGASKKAPAQNPVNNRPLPTPPGKPQATVSPPKRPLPQPPTATHQSFGSPSSSRSSSDAEASDSDNESSSDSEEEVNVTADQAETTFTTLAASLSQRRKRMNPDGTFRLKKGELKMASRNLQNMFGPPPNTGN